MKQKEHISSGAIADGFARVVEKWHKVENRPQEYGTGILLSRSEVKLLETIGDYPGSSVTELARLHAVTKGAISQTLKKLEAKELTVKKRDPANSSRLLVDLTKGGEKAYRAHQEWHDEVGGGFKSYVNGLSRSNVEFLHEFIVNLESFLDNRMKSGMK